MRKPLFSMLTAVVLLGLLVLPAPQARAQTCDAASVRKLKKLNIDAMDENDRWELDKARQKLEDAKLVAKNRGCLEHSQHALTRLLLGVIALRNRKPDLMEKEWLEALRIDPDAELPRRVQSAKVNRLFAAVKVKAKTMAPRRAAPGTPSAPRPSGPPKGFEHVPVVKWEEGKTLTLRARAAKNLSVQRVSLFLKPGGASAVQRLELSKVPGDEWTWRVEVPGSLLRGNQLQYYLVAYTADDKEVAASGNSANMHIVQLTSAAAPARRGGSGMENPLTGGSYRRPPPRRRRAAPRVGHRLESPDAPPERRRVAARTPATTVRKTKRAPAASAPPLFFASLGLGTGIGLMQGRTEVVGEETPDEVSLGSFYGQVELGYLITRKFSVNLFGRFGYLFISDEVKDPRGMGIDKNPQGNDKDVLLLIRARYQSARLLRADLPINLRWYVGGGVGWGILRHLVRASHPTEDKDVVDSDRSTGFVPNIFGGLSMCVVRSCQINVHAEVNYLATFTINTDLNTPFHMDFTLGANFAF